MRAGHEPEAALPHYGTNNRGNVILMMKSAMLWTMCLWLAPRTS